MKTSIKYNALRSMPLDQARSCLKQAIDLELRKPQILLSYLEQNKHLLRRAVNEDGTARPVSFDEKSVLGFIRDNLHMLLSADDQKAALSGNGVSAGKMLFGEKYASGSDNPILIDLASSFASWFHSNMPEMDTGYLQLFDLVDLRNSPHDHFDVNDTNMGIVFEQIAPGQQIKKRTKVTESRTQCGYATFGAGVGILDDWITKQMYWRIDEVIAEFRANHFDQKANIHYSLFTALGSGIDTAFSVDDTTTFNAAAATMLRNLRTSGYPLGQNASLKIICAPEKVGRIMRMLQAQQGSQLVSFGTLKEPIAYTVDGVISTTWVPAADTGYYLVLPGKKAKRGEWQDLSIEQQRDAATRATDWFASSQYNALIGDSNQVRRVKYA